MQEEKVTQDKKTYQRPTLEKRERLVEVTEGGDGNVIIIAVSP